MPARSPGRVTPPLLFCVLLLGGVAAAGCSGKGDVSGQVKVGDKPLPSGRIYFQLQEGNKDEFPGLIKNGSYEIKGLPPGEVKVRVESFKPPAGNVENIPGKDLGIMRDKPVPGSGEGLPYIPIPERYGSFENSGLDFTVTRGAQTKDFTLEKDKQE